MPFVCERCGASFPKNQGLTKHKERKTPCTLILENEDLPEEKRDSPNRCKFCGRVFSTRSNMQAHMKKACKIVPRNGDMTGMEKLYEHALRKKDAENAALIRRLEALEARAGISAAAATTEAEQGAAPATMASRAVDANRLALGAPVAAPAVKSVQGGIVANVGAGGTFNANTNTNIDNSVGKTTVNVNINVFGQENLSRITKPQVVDLLRGLGPVGENVKAIAEKAIIQAAMLIFSDPAHPEDITCYLPNKKGDNALVHGETGWEVQPVGLVISPMAAQGIEMLFKHQPAPDQYTPENDVKWMMEECGNIMRYIQKHEGDMTNEPPRGELRGILIRNKELLQQVLAKLPMAGQH
jgi:hypothetical protein